jgi:hypothetical protein
MFGAFLEDWRELLGVGWIFRKAISDHLAHLPLMILGVFEIHVGSLSI